MSNDDQPQARPGKNQFGTFGGVFTPSLLTILGVIMFLRAGFIVGEAGVRGAIIILLLAESISLLSAISMSAIATNTQVKGGGAYFLISRVLGPQFGGSIGLTLYLAQALSIPFYTVGFTEALVVSFPLLRPYFLFIGLGTATALFVLNYIGARWAIKAQFIVMTLLGLAIFTFLGGAILRFDPATLHANLEPGYTRPELSFWAIFAIYFPAVTGILAGINMSGDLKDPSRSLVRGTFAAIFVGTAIYLLQMILCGGSQARPDLIHRPYETLLANSLFGMSFLVMGGVFSATLSSAVGSFLGAPRVLQALARDKIIPGLGIFARGTKKGDEPRVAIWLTFAITLVIVFFSSGKNARDAFDMVAGVITMFFLCTYGMINLAAFVESFGQNPSFRPRFKWFHWSVSLLGALACVGVMFLINVVSAIIAIVVITIIYILISRRVFESTFGDARRGFLFSVVSRALGALRDMQPHPKNWRPTFLVLSGNPQSRLTLIRFGDWMEAQRGIVTAVAILVGKSLELVERRKQAEANIRKFLDERELSVFPEIVVAQDMDEAIRLIVQTHSIGPIKPNTVIMGWPHDNERITPFVRHIRDISAFGRSVLCIVDRGLPDEEHEAEHRIDIWWRGRDNGSLMLILAHLLRHNWEWEDSTIRIIRHVTDEAGRDPSRKALQAIVNAGRIEAEVLIVVSSDPFSSVLKKYSRNSQLVFMGFELPEEADAEPFFNHFDELLQQLPTAILVRSSGEADLMA